MASKVRELASGVDALYLSGHAQLSASLVAELGAKKKVAMDSGSGIPFVIGAHSFTLSPGGFGRYRYRLEHEYGQIGITDSEQLPAFRVQPRSDFLHAVGPPAVVDWYQAVLDLIAHQVTLSVSRIDLHSDWQGWVVGGDDRRRFVCRARERDTYEQGETLSGFAFGKRASNTIHARIYDKTLEVKQKGHDWWIDKWGNAFDREQPVIRVEFEFGRQGITSFGVSQPEEVLEAVGDFWRYATHDWLTYRDPTFDGTRSRWPVADDWRHVQSPLLRGEVLGLARVRDGRRRGSLRTLLPALNGYVAAFAAEVGTDTVEQTLAALGPYLRHYEHTSGRGFSARVQERRGAA